VHNFQELMKKASEMYSDWMKNLAALSIAALTILVSMMPDIPPSPPANYFLAACWLLLAVCIPLSLAASFRPVVESKKLAISLLDLQRNPNSEGKVPGSELTIKLYKQDRVLYIAQFVAVGSFCLSFISLAVYAIISVLAV